MRRPLHQTRRIPRNSRDGAGLRARRLSRILLIIACAIIASTAFGQSQPSVTVRPSEMPSDVLLIVDGSVIPAESLQLQRGQQMMVWIRELEKLGWGTVESTQPDRVSLRSKSVTLTFVKGQGVAMVNSLSVRLPIDTYMRDGRFMVPLSFVAKALGYQYDLGIKPVVTISTASPTAVSSGGGAISGRVTYNGSGVPSIVVRAVDKTFTVVPDAVDRTDSKGDYTITGLPDGDYMAYVYTGDNPGLFNRASKPARVVNGQTVEMEPIVLGRIIAPVSPPAGAKGVALSGDTVSFRWKPLDGAAKYKLVIKEPGSERWTYWTEVTQPEARVPTKSLRSGRTYEAQVTALDKKGEFLGGTAGAGGTPWTFTAR